MTAKISTVLMSSAKISLAIMVTVHWLTVSLVT
jgi:hypothetical protein